MDFSVYSGSFPPAERCSCTTGNAGRMEEATASHCGSARPAPLALGTPFTPSAAHVHESLCCTLVGVE